MNKQNLNFAPLKPLTDLKDESVPEKTALDHDLVRELRRKYEEKIRENAPQWREMIAAGMTNALFIQGEQILRFNEFDGTPKIVKPNQQDPLHLKIVNEMQFFAINWQHKWRSSKRDILISAISDGDEALARARKANAVADHLEAKFFTNWFDLHEGLNAQVWGWYGRRVAPDHRAKIFASVREIWGEKETVVGRGFGKCEKCGYRGAEVKIELIGRKNFDLCPECGDYEYEFEPPVRQVIPYRKRREKIFLPEIICESLLFPSVRFDIAARAEESSWLITEKRITPNALRRIIGNLQIPEGESGNETGLDVIDTLARRGTASEGAAGAQSAKDTSKVVLTEMYLSADDLYDIRIGGEEKTVEGGTLPKGRRLSEVFPDGCLVTGVNGLKMILGIYAGSHRETVTSGVYHMKPSSGTGRGVDDARNVNRQINRRYSQIDAHFASRGTPPLLAVEGAFEPQDKKLFNQPGAVIPIKLQNFPEIRDLNQLVRPMQGAEISGGLVDYTLNHLKMMMQTAYHITNFGGASPQGVHNTTATYAQINDANADAIFTPTLSIKAETDVATVRNGFNLWCEYTPEPRFIRFKKQSAAGAIGDEIAGRDIAGEYVWSYVPGSEAPKTRFTESQKRAQFFAMFPGGVQGYLTVKQQFPTEIAEIERDFDVNFASESYDGIGETCRLRFERAKAALAESDDLRAILAALEPSLLITEAALTEKALWFQNLLDSTEGMKMTTRERELVSAFILVFKELSKGQTMQMQRDAGEIQMAAQAPQREAAQAAQQSQMQMQQAAAQEQQSQAMIGGLTKAAIDEDAQIRAQDHEREMQDNHAAMQTIGMMHEAQENEAQRAHETGANTA